MVLTELTVIIISQYIHISNHYVVYFKLIQCYMSIIYEWNWRKAIKVNHKGTKKSNHVSEMGRSDGGWLEEAKSLSFIAGSK